MRRLKLAAIVGGLALIGVGGVLALTNPNQENYEAFATQKLTTYLGDNVCIKAPFGLKEQCKSALVSNRAEIQKLISDGTRQQNYLFFSIYTTDLSLTSLLPSYHFETVAVFQQFYVYQAKQQ